MRKLFLSSFVLAVLLVASSVLLRSQAQTHQHSGHIVVLPDAVKWTPAPPGLPPGAQAAVLAGDPASDRAYTLLLKAPDGYRVAPHWHPKDENLTVLKGTFHIGLGEKFDKSKGQKMPVGAYTLMPKEMRHFAWTEGETIAQIHGIGPFEIIYVNPADDPRKSRQ